MTDYKIFLGYTSIIISFASYVPYLWGIYRGYIKPHGFTWFVWGVLTAIGFVAQIVSGGEAGSWLLAFNSVFCLSIAGIAFWQGHVKYVVFDWLSLAGAFLAMILWILTNNPLIAVILISLSDGIAILPTVRKAYYFPNEESIFPWLLGIFSHAIAVFALESLTITTWLYPASIIVYDLLIVIEVGVRRKQITK